VDADVRAGRTVVCNVSRTIVAAARTRYADVLVALITAPPDVLAARLAARSRGSDGDLARRLARAEAFADFAADGVIASLGAPETGAAALMAAIDRTTAARSTTAAARSSASAS